MRVWVRLKKRKTRCSRRGQTSSPVPPPGDLWQRCLTSDWCRHLANWTKHTRHLWFWPIPKRPYSLQYENVTSSTKPEVITCRIAVRGRPCHSHTYMNRKFGEIWTCSFWYIRADIQTDTHTNTQTRYADHNTFHPYRGRTNFRKHCVRLTWLVIQ